jgi:hypothetical protein
MTARLLVAALVVFAGAVAAQQPMAHMEACTEWDYVDGEFGARNGCEKPIAILFMALGDQRIVQANVPPGARFKAGAHQPDLANGWLFTACPVGYVPNVKFSVANGRTILDSLYNCLPAGSPDV